MKASRRNLYDELFERTANTPLVTYQGAVPNGNTVLIKRECDLQYGSHYDRVYVKLFYEAEKSGTLKPGSKVLETTSGSAGVSFAGIGKELGYECLVAIPEGGEKARETAVLKYLPSADHLIYTPADDYISGFPKFLRGYLAKHKGTFFLNHSMGARDPKGNGFLNNEYTLAALQSVADEVSSDNIDLFLPASGNGSTILGIGQHFDTSTQVIAFETFQSAATYEQQYPGQYEHLYGISPGTLTRHKLPGTSYNGIDFPHIRNAVQQGITDDVMLVSDQKTDSEFLDITHEFITRASPVDLPHWDMDLPKADDLGRSSRAGLAVALDAATQCTDKNILIIGYDKEDRYDPIP